MRWGLGLQKVVWKKLMDGKRTRALFVTGTNCRRKKHPSLVHTVVFETILPGWFTKRSGKIFNRRQLLENLWFIDINEASRRNLKNIAQCANSYYWQTWGCVTHQTAHRSPIVLEKHPSGLFCGFSWNHHFISGDFERTWGFINSEERTLS